MHKIRLFKLSVNFVLAKVCTIFRKIVGFYHETFGSILDASILSCGQPGYINIRITYMNYCENLDNGKRYLDFECAIFSSVHLRIPSMAKIVTLYNITGSK
jgi:hypothetical protein